MEEAFHGFPSSGDEAETTVSVAPDKNAQTSKKQTAPKVVAASEEKGRKKASKKQTAPMDVAVSEEEGITREDAIYARDRAAKSIRKTAEWIANTNDDQRKETLKFVRGI
ncbi:hypothetical protein ZHAS_00010394 [Anopheles sinensis]|uniref:Uncharacterized protein n=1 Tax=Anopheles sinensis TaxID=74873 RepID=A0A084VXG8_ANOSI|nr:hypothetical protein ZHAS_00010394 [Anopheles sinensis]